MGAGGQGKGSLGSSERWKPPPPPDPGSAQVPFAAPGMPMSGPLRLLPEPRRPGGSQPGPAAHRSPASPACCREPRSSGTGRVRFPTLPASG